MHRMSRLAAGISLALAGLVCIPAIAGETSSCTATVDSTGESHALLQTAVDAAADGDEIRVQGVCPGPTVIDKNLVLRGVHAPGEPLPSLSGAGEERVLWVNAAAPVTVKVRDLHIRDGFSIGNIGGIQVDNARLVLAGNTVVSDNRGRYAPGGIYIRSTATVVMRDHATLRRNGSLHSSSAALVHGTLIVTDHAEVARNHGSSVWVEFQGVLELRRDAAIRSSGGTGIRMNWGSVRMAGRSAIRGLERGVYGRGGIHMAGHSRISGNGDQYGEGGGVYLEGGHLTLRDHAVIARNHAEYGAGVYVPNLRYDPTVRLRDESAVRHNAATVQGGGILNRGGTVQIGRRALVAHNTPNDCVRC